MRVSDRAVTAIKQWEGLRTKAYRDVVGVWTIGYGHASTAGGPKVTPGMVITEAEAERILRNDLREFEEGVLKRCTRTPNQNQFDGMVSLSFNIGLGAFGKSTCLRRFNAGDFKGAAEALQWFNKAGGKVYKGLVRRRAREAQWFLEAPGENPPVDYERKEQPAPTHPPAGFLPVIIAAVVAALAGAFVWLRNRKWRFWK